MHPTYTIIPGKHGYLVRRRGETREDFHFSSVYDVQKWIGADLARQIMKPEDFNIPSVLFGK